MDVSCESCHGPGSRHVAWAQAHVGGDSNPTAPGLSEADRLGLTNWLKAADQGHWAMNPETGIAKRTAPLASAELDTCASCHARRRVIVKNAVPDGRFLDQYLPALLEPGLYHADGQIDGEVYRIRFLHPKPHAPRGRHMFGLPRPAQPCAARRGQRALRPMPPAGKVRHGGAPPSPTRQYRRAVRRLSYADEDIHGRGSQARPQLSCPAAGSVGVDRHAERLHPVPYRSPRGLGRARDRRMVSAGPSNPTALRDRTVRWKDRRRRCGTTPRRADPGSKPTGYCARERPAAAAPLRHTRVGSRDQVLDRRSQCARSVRGAPRAAAFSVTNRGSGSRSAFE